MRLGQQHCDDAQHAQAQQGADNDRGQRGVLLRIVINDVDRGRGRGIHHDGQEQAAASAQRAAVQIEDAQQQRCNGHRDASQQMPVRHAHNRIGEHEFGLALHVVHAPIGTDATLVERLPRLVKSLHHVIDVAFLFGAMDKTAQE